MADPCFIKDRVRSVGFALKGAWLLLTTEGSIQVQGAIAIAVTGAGWYFRITPTEWMVQLLAIGMVMGIEGLNTAVEKLADYVQPGHDAQIGKVKDISAGAVLLASVMAGMAGLVIYLPRIF